MYVSTLLCFLRDCMKGDETENKKIGCTVNLMVKMFPLFLCDPVQCCWNWCGKSWSRNLCRGSVVSECKHRMTGQKNRGCEDPLEVSGPTLCLKQGQTGQVPGALSSWVPSTPVTGVPWPLALLFSLWLPSFWKNSWRDKMSGLCECEKNYSFSFTLIMYSLFKTFIHTQMLLIVLNDGRVSITACFFLSQNFYKSEINKEEMYIRYIHKLCDMHLQAENYTG